MGSDRKRKHKPKEKRRRIKLGRLWLWPLGLAVLIGGTGALVGSTQLPSAALKLGIGGALIGLVGGLLAALVNYIPKRTYKYTDGLGDSARRATVGGRGPEIEED